MVGQEKTSLSTSSGALFNMALLVIKKDRSTHTWRIWRKSRQARRMWAEQMQDIHNVRRAFRTLPVSIGEYKRRQTVPDEPMEGVEVDEVSDYAEETCRLEKNGYSRSPADPPPRGESRRSRTRGENAQMGLVVTAGSG